jgi:RNA polymerase sigma factor (sigma-70 family)
VNRSSDSNDVNAEVEAIWSATCDGAARHVRSKARGATDDALVDDAIAEAALRLHRQLRLGRAAPADPAAWMNLVAWREYLRLIERRDSHYGGEVRDEIAADPGDSLAEVLERLGDDAIAQAFVEAIDRLSGHQRAVVIDYAAGHTYRETAQRLGISPGAVNKALVRAKRSLRHDGCLAQQVEAWRD